MLTEFEFCSGNIHIILIALVVLCISIFFFIELKKLKIRINVIENKLNIETKGLTDPPSLIEKMMDPLGNNTMKTPMQQPIPTQMKPILFSNNSPNIMPNYQSEQEKKNQEDTDIKSFVVNNIDTLNDTCDVKVDVNKLNDEIKQQMELPEEDTSEENL